MTTKIQTAKFKISDPIGIHIRPASVLAKAAGQYRSKIEMTYQTKKANMKSVMSLMSLGVPKGAEIIIEVSGDDCDEALKAIKASLKSNKLIG